MEVMIKSVIHGMRYRKVGRIVTGRITLLGLATLCLGTGCDAPSSSAPRLTSTKPAAWSLQVASTPLERETSRAFAGAGEASRDIEESNQNVAPDLENPRWAIDPPRQGKEPRRIAVYGEGVDDTGTIHLGIVPTGVRHQWTFLVKVHDEVTSLEVVDIRVVPEFLEVQFQPYGRNHGIRNLYHLRVALPATAPACVYRVHRLGSIEITFEHPRIERLKLDVDFVLQGDRGLNWALAAGPRDLSSNRLSRTHGK